MGIKGNLHRPDKSLAREAWAIWPGLVPIGCTPLSQVAQALSLLRRYIATYVQYTARREGHACSTRGCFRAMPLGRNLCRMASSPVPRMPSALVTARISEGWHRGRGTGNSLLPCSGPEVLFLVFREHHKDLVNRPPVLVPSLRWCVETLALPSRRPG